MSDALNFDAFLQQLLASSLAEQIAVAAGIGYALLVIRRSRWAWVFGGVSSAILAVLAGGAALPLQAVLQGAYVLMAVYGFWHWTRESGEPVAITVWPWKWHVVAVVVTAVVAFAAAPWLAANGAAWPMLDAGVTVVSLLATWMVARAVLENWVYWLLVDAVSFFLYAAQGLAFVSMLYAIYFVIAVFGLRSWLRSWRAV